MDNKQMQVAKQQQTQPMLVEEIALQKINNYKGIGFQLPDGYNATNALKQARLMLNGMIGTGKRPVLEECTQQSIVSSLVEMVTKGLNVAEQQAYFIQRGDKLTLMESVYGRILRAKRASRNYKPIVCFVHEGDTFEFATDVETGLTKVTKFETRLENLDKPIIAAFTYVTDDSGDTNVFVMTKRQWMASWAKSPNGAAVAKSFGEDMIKRTIIKKATKELVNSAIPTFMRESEEDDEPDMTRQEETPVQEYEEVHDDDVEEAVTEEVQEAPQTAIDFNNDNDEF